MKWLGALLAIMLCTPSWAAGGLNRAQPRGPAFTDLQDFPYVSGSGGGGSLNDSSFWLPPFLANPVWRAAADAEVTVTFVPNHASRWRVQYGTTPALGSTLTTCFENRTTIGGLSETPCDTAINVRVDFILDALNEDTRYHYQVEGSTDGGTTWKPYAQSSFTTLTSNTATDQHFAYISDEHSPTVHGSSVCGSADTGGGWARFNQTLSNIITNHGSHNYRLYLTTGDNALTHLRDDGFDPCQNVMGKSPHLDNGCANCEGGITTQNEADARWLIYLKTVQPVTKSIPLVITLGNHEAETQYSEDVSDLSTLAGLSANNAYWYFDASNNIDVYSRTARLKYMPNPDFTYTSTSGDGGANGNYYSVASGAFELVITDIEGGPGPDLDADANPREFPSDFPGACPTAVEGDTGTYIACSASFPARGPNDWDYTDAECTFLTGANPCNGAGGRLAGGATTWAATGTITGIKWKFLAAHHGANSSTTQAAGKLYGRGGMGNLARVCNTTDSAAGRAGGFCTLASDCDITPPVAQACCDPGESGACLGDASLATRNTGTLAGTTQANLQALAKTWASAGGKKFFFLYGHDHLSTCAQKHDGGGATGVYYCEGTQPGDAVDDPGWMDTASVKEVYDWGGLSNQPDGIPDYCSDATLQAIVDGGSDEIGACGGSTSTNSLGSTLRGYLAVRVNGLTNVTVTQYSTVLDMDTNIKSVMSNNTAEWTFTVP